MKLSWWLFSLTSQENSLALRSCCVTDLEFRIINGMSKMKRLATELDISTPRKKPIKLQLQRYKGVICIMSPQKFYLIHKPEEATINSRDEFFSGCLHKHTLLLWKSQSFLSVLNFWPSIFKIDCSVIFEFVWWVQGQLLYETFSNKGEYQRFVYSIYIYNL